MSRRSPLIPCAPLVLLLAGCWNGRAVLLFEQPQWETLGNTTLVSARLAGDSLAAGFFPQIAVIAAAQSPMDRLVRAAGVLRRGAVVVGPLLSYEWGSYAARFPQVHFVLVADLPPAELPSNVVLLSFDRTAALRSAGRQASDAAAAKGGHVGVLTSEASDLTGTEVAAFLDGAASAAGASTPDTRSLHGPPDRAAVQSAIGDLRRGGAEVILLGLGALDPWALEAMKAAGGRAVLADWRTSGAAPSVVLLSVEEDLPAGISRALRAVSRGERTAAGPVDLVQGGAPQ